MGHLASNVDTDDWEIGEDLPGGAIREWSTPRTMTARQRQGLGRQGEQRGRRLGRRPLQQVERHRLRRGKHLGFDFEGLGEVRIQPSTARRTLASACPGAHGVGAGSRWACRPSHPVCRGSGSRRRTCRSSSALRALRVLEFGFADRRASLASPRGWTSRNVERSIFPRPSGRSSSTRRSQLYRRISSTGSSRRAWPPRPTAPEVNTRAQERGRANSTFMRGV